MRNLLRGRRRAWLAVPVVLLAAVGGVGAWLLTQDSSAAETPTTMTVTAATMKETVAASGTLQPRRSAELDFEVAGTVTEVYVEEGDRVGKGQALARVDDEALVANRTAAAAALVAANAQLADDQDADASATQLAADRAAVLAAEASLDEAKRAASDATLRATIAGTVVSLDLAVGDLVGESDAAEAADGETTSAVRVVSTGRFVVDATVAAADVTRLKKGLQADITPVGVTEPVYGTVASVGLVAETSSSGAAVFPVTIDVTGRRRDLYAGTSADAAVVVKQVEDVLTVPSRALQTDDDGTTYVDEVVGDETVKTVVEIGTTYGMATEIVSGLEEGDEVEIPTFTPDSGSGDPGQQRVPGGGGQAPQFQFNGPPQ